MPRRTRLARIAVAALLAAPIARPALAHVGPPFPILEDRRLGPYVVGLWTDPDIGTATFIVVLDPPEGRKLPPWTRVRIAVQPMSGRLREATYVAQPEQAGEGARYLALVHFDKGEMWKVHVSIGGPEGGGDIRTQIEATPPGDIGPIGLVLYPLPFVAMGFLWLKAAVRRHKAAANPPTPP
jgi:hypothetical protein